MRGQSCNTCSCLSVAQQSWHRWGASRIIRYKPDGSPHLEVIFPTALNVTACCFGGTPPLSACRSLTHHGVDQGSMRTNSTSRRHIAARLEGMHLAKPTTLTPGISSPWIFPGVSAEESGGTRSLAKLRGVGPFEFCPMVWTLSNPIVPAPTVPPCDMPTGHLYESDACASKYFYSRQSHILLPLLASRRRHSVNQ